MDGTIRGETVLKTLEYGVEFGTTKKADFSDGFLGETKRYYFFFSLIRAALPCLPRR
jgi:hypothetical protein